MKKTLILLVVFLLSACATAPKSYTKTQMYKPKKIIITMPYDGQGWREDWRIAFEKYGYEIYFHDEIFTSNRTTKSETLDVQKLNVIDDKDIKVEFRLNYHGVWDVVWYVQSVSLAVRDLTTGKVIASYRDGNYWAHPSVDSVVEDIEKNFLSEIWINTKDLK